MDMVQTVRIRSDAPGHQPAGYVVINAADFDPQAHALFDAPMQPKTAPTNPPKAKRPADAGAKE